MSQREGEQLDEIQLGKRKSHEVVSQQEPGNNSEDSGSDNSESKNAAQKLKSRGIGLTRDRRPNVKGPNI